MEEEEEEGEALKGTGNKKMMMKEREKRWI